MEAGQNNNVLNKTLRITEIYTSIQGESTWAGLPCVFVRLTGCNLRCDWCDTQYSYDEGESMTLGAILERVEGLGVKLVELTGGEPLAQENCPLLAELLLERGYTVLFETNGALPINRLPGAVIKIMDLKCPDSGMSDRNHWPNLDYLSPAQDEVKFVIASRRDYEWSREVIREHRLEHRCKALLLSPVFGRIEAQQLAAWMLEDALPVRLQLQLHKLIWPPGERGV